MLPASDSPHDPKPRRGAFLVLPVILLLLVGSAAYAGYLMLRSPESPYPEKWDARIEPFAKVVEAQRGLTFEHPIYVDFLSVKEFQDKVTSDKDDLSGKDRKELAHTEGMMRAVGLLEGKVDLFESSSDLAGAGILGYYSYDDKRIRIRGEKLTPAVQSTLVHELTHALQDQHFDLGTRFKALENGADGASTAYQAMVEGDASRIETDWANGLGKKRRAALDRSQAAQSKKFKSQSSDIPEVLGAFIGSPYVLGEAMLALAVERDGDAAVNQLFAKPPTTDEHLLDPWTLIEDHEEPLGVAKPKLAAGEEKFDSGTFGAIGWLFMLAERVPAPRVLDAVDGWGGDSYVAFERDGVSCVRINYQGDTKGDLTEMESSLRSWIAEQPKGKGQVRVDHHTLVFESCDPGKRSVVGRSASQDILGLAASRTYLSSVLLDAGPDFARCASDRLVHAFTVKELNDPDIKDKIPPVVIPCR
jgi:hypothetical protein